MPFTKDNIEQTREMYNKYMTGRTIPQLTSDLIDFTETYFNLKQNKNSKAIIGISTGKDSTCLLGILTKAIDPERVICVSMPLHSSKVDSKSIIDVKQETIDILNHFNIPKENRIESLILEDDLKLTNHRPLIMAGTLDFETQNKWDMSKPELRNLAARIRMAKLYYLAQINNARVANTSNQSESVAGWFTKWGDCVGDFFPFSELTASEVVLVGLELGIPEKWMFKVPDDGLIGTSDEEALGFTYNQLDEEIMKLKINQDDLLPVSFEYNLPADMRKRYIDGMHKRFSMYISYGENGYIPVFYNTPKIVDQNGLCVFKINDLNRNHLI